MGMARIFWAICDMPYAMGMQYAICNFQCAAVNDRQATATRLQVTCNRQSAIGKGSKQQVITNRQYRVGKMSKAIYTGRQAMGHRQYATGDDQLGVTICNSFGIHTWHTQCHIRKAPKLPIIRPQALTQMEVPQKNIFTLVLKRILQHFTRRVICAYFQDLFAKTEDFIAQNLSCVTFYLRNLL